MIETYEYVVKRKGKVTKLAMYVTQPEDSTQLIEDTLEDFRDENGLNNLDKRINYIKSRYDDSLRMEGVAEIAILSVMMF